MDCQTHEVKHSQTIFEYLFPLKIYDFEMLDATLNHFPIRI